MLDTDPYANWSKRDRLQMLTFEAEPARLPRSLIAAVWDADDTLSDMTWKPSDDIDREVRAWMKAKGWNVTRFNYDSERKVYAWRHDVRAVHHPRSESPGLFSRLRVGSCSRLPAGWTSRASDSRLGHLTPPPPAGWIIPPALRPDSRSCHVVPSPASRLRSLRSRSPTMHIGETSHQFSSNRAASQCAERCGDQDKGVVSLFTQFSRSTSTM
jgi:hypothetical protein